jgi:hypothetical protein
MVLLSQGTIDAKTLGRVEVFTAVTMENAVFWDVKLCDFVRTDISEECSASIIWVTIIGELRALAVTSNRITLQRNTSQPHGVISPKTAFFITTYTQNCMISVLCSLSGIINARKHNVSDTWSISVVR